MERRGSHLPMTGAGSPICRRVLGHAARTGRYNGSTMAGYAIARGHADAAVALRSPFDFYFAKVQQ